PVRLRQLPPARKTTMRKEFDPRSITASRSFGFMDPAYSPRRRCLRRGERAAVGEETYWTAAVDPVTVAGAGRGARARESDRDARGRRHGAAEPAARRRPPAAASAGGFSLSPGNEGRWT